MKKVIDENLESRRNLRGPIMELIDEAIEEFFQWKNTLKLDPLIKKLQERCEIIKSESLDYIYRKTEITIKDQAVVEKMIGSALKKSMKPIFKLKTIEDIERLEDYIEVVNEIFRM